ncbi:MAG: hypothetical protein U9Q20_00395, partial [Campylobacterota bacterium]|nr:hypothetical protein [Campylobacterota bacterium]
MFNFFRNKSINQINQITVFFIATITILLIVGLFANRYSNHQNELEKLKSDYLTSQKQLIK